MSDGAVVTAPVVKTVQVTLPPAETFTLFTRDMGRWWPLEIHSIAVDSLDGRVEALALVFEEFEGGRIYEVMSDGAEGMWGHVLVWEPPKRVVFTWKPNLTDDPVTEVEVRFRPSGSGTEVELEHRGWERLGAVWEKKRDGYDKGWPRVLKIFEDFAEGI
jgi:uncharacterized protein YndB with AHSA1/START domain